MLRHLSGFKARHLSKIQKEWPTHSSPPYKKGDLYLNKLCLEVFLLLVKHEDLTLVAGQLAVFLLHQLKLLQSANHLNSTQLAYHPAPVTPITNPPAYATQPINCLLVEHKLVAGQLAAFLLNQLKLLQPANYLSSTQSAYHPAPVTTITNPPAYATQRNKCLMVEHEDLTLVAGQLAVLLLNQLKLLQRIIISTFSNQHIISTFSNQHIISNSSPINQYLLLV